MNSNRRRRRFLCREVMPVRLRKHSPEILLKMDSYRLQTFARSFGRAERNIDTRWHWKKRADSLSGVYICISLSTCTRQLLLMYYMHAQHIFCYMIEIENVSSASGLCLPLGPLDICTKFKTVEHVDTSVKLSSVYL